ncbi:hypothetical protein [Quadrisphaera sp. DSM 44207]|uniref:hypothetical protein n=1 Tax=Quadrisphaera sp. DSM 44207 TaxID=1881057 RepID=UPI00088F11D1|nr:hypothetical protein [Quadrisphaera sp. DSM 44207]SDQ06632.1 hypothetical protein SAMN05428996_0313 [Quadrisphaera sp. DSM 44207]
MTRPPSIAAATAQTVAAARPPQDARAAHPLLPIAQAARQRDLDLVEMAVDVGLPGGWPLAGLVTQVRVAAFAYVDPPGGSVVLSVRQREVRLRFSPQLKVAAGLGGRLQATYGFHVLSYDFSTQQVSCPVQLLAAGDDTSPGGPAARGAQEIADTVVEKMADRLRAAVQATRMGRRDYSILTDQDPLATARAVLEHFVRDPGRSRTSALVTLAKLQELSGAVDVLRQAAAEVAAAALSSWAAPEVSSGLLLSQVRLRRVSLSFSLLRAVRRPEGAARALRVEAGTSLQVAGRFDVDLLTLSSLLGPVGTTPGTAATVSAVAPRLGFQGVDLSGAVQVVYGGEAVATLRDVGITADGAVEVVRWDLTARGEQLLSAAMTIGGVDLIAMDRTLGSLVGAFVSLLAFLDGVRASGAAGRGAGAADALSRFLAGGLQHHESLVVEPLGLRVLESEVESALTSGLRHLLHVHVERPLGMTLRQLFGHEPVVRIP